MGIFRTQICKRRGAAWERSILRWTNCWKAAISAAMNWPNAPASATPLSIITIKTKLSATIAMFSSVFAPRWTAPSLSLCAIRSEAGAQKHLLIHYQIKAKDALWGVFLLKCAINSRICAEKWKSLYCTQKRGVFQ